MTPPTVLHWPASSGGGGSWTPSSVASLAHWYDASLETGSNGSSITTAIDQAGSTDLTTSSGGVTLLTNWSNGLAGYDFDPAVGHTLSASSVTTLSGAPDAWVFLVHDCQNAAANPFVWHYSGTSGSDPFFSIHARSWGSYWFRVQGSPSSTGGGSSAGGKTILGMRTDGSTLHAYQDGTALTLGTSAITSGFPVQTAALMSLGNDNFGNKMDGVIGEVIVGNGTLSNADRENIEGYLAHKWGLTANLPASHPYKSTAP